MEGTGAANMFMLIFAFCVTSHAKNIGPTGLNTVTHAYSVTPPSPPLAGPTAVSFGVTHAYGSVTPTAIPVTSGTAPTEASPPVEEEKPVNPIDIPTVNLTIDECGESIYDAQKIVNGTPVTSVGEFPWMAAIGFTLEGTSKFNWWCGGSLITYQHVLTAAHCLKMRGDDNLLYIPTKVRFAELNFDENVDDGATPFDVEVDKYFWHQQYNKVTGTNDIGLIKLKSKVKYNPLNAVPICLPPAGVRLPVYPHTNLVVAGWGRTKYVPVADELRILRKTNLKEKELEKCRSIIKRMGSEVVINESVICASQPLTSPCTHDSGGPLMLFTRIPGGRAKMYVYGTVSYGFSCDTRGYPNIFTRVSKFMQWISHHTAQ